VRVLKGLPVSLKTRMPLSKENSLLILSAASGGERQRKSASSDTGYSEKAQRTGTPAYLEPNSNGMQKPIGGLLALLKNVEDRSAIGGSRNQKHAEKTEHSTDASALIKGGHSLSRATVTDKLHTNRKNLKRRLILPLEVAISPAQSSLFSIC
jgi:hypothetical protein